MRSRLIVPPDPADANPTRSECLPGHYLDRAALDDLLAVAENQAGSVRTNLQLLWGVLHSPVMRAAFAD